MPRSRSMTTYLHASTALIVILMSTSTVLAWTTLPQLSSVQKSRSSFLPTSYKGAAASSSAGRPEFPIGNNLQPKSVNETTLDEIKRKYVAVVHDDENADPTNTEKSDVYKAQRKCEDTGEPVGDHVVIKLSQNHHGMKREAATYRALQSDSFVSKHESYEPTHETDVSVIVMESGETDLTKYINKNSPLSLKDVREKAKIPVNALTALHEQNMVWCDMKTCNFVVLKNGEVKGIDLESATLVGTPNYMHSAAGAPPEYAVEHLQGRNMLMELSFDIWSLGMVLYHFAVGEHYFAPRCSLTDENQLFNYLKDAKQLDFTKLNASYVDTRLRDLIISCLQYDPHARPTIQEIREHPFFS